MIGLVRLRASTEGGIETLADLPRPPALEWSAFLVRLGGSIGLRRMVAWAAHARRSRPFLPIGIVTGPVVVDAATLASLAEAGAPFDPVIDVGRVRGGFVLDEDVAILRQKSVESTIVGRWSQLWGVRDRPTIELLYALAAVGVRGCKAYSLRISAPGGGYLSLATVRRRLSAAALPSPGKLLGQARVWSVQLRLELGIRRAEAVAAAGWRSAKLYEKARARQR